MAGETDLPDIRVWKALISRQQGTVRWAYGAPHHIIEEQKRQLVDLKLMYMAYIARSEEKLSSSPAPSPSTSLAELTEEKLSSPPAPSPLTSLAELTEEYSGLLKLIDQCFKGGLVAFVVVALVVGYIYLPKNYNGQALKLQRQNRKNKARKLALKHLKLKHARALSGLTDRASARVLKLEQDLQTAAQDYETLRTEYRRMEEEATQAIDEISNSSSARVLKLEQDLADQEQVHRSRMSVYRSKQWKIREAIKERHSKAMEEVAELEVLIKRTMVVSELKVFQARAAYKAQGESFSSERAQLQRVQAVSKVKASQALQRQVEEAKARFQSMDGHYIAQLKKKQEKHESELQYRDDIETGLRKQIHQLLNSAAACQEQHNTELLCCNENEERLLLLIQGLQFESVVVLQEEEQDLPNEDLKCNDAKVQELATKETPETINKETIEQTSMTTNNNTTSEISVAEEGQAEMAAPTWRGYGAILHTVRHYTR